MFIFNKLKIIFSKIAFKVNKFIIESNLSINLLN